MAIPEGRVQDVPGDELRVDPADPAVWERIAAAWPRRDYRLLHRVMEARDLPVAPIDRLFDAATLEHERPDPTSVLEIAFACRQEDSALVGLYVCACCLDAWERTGDHERIRGVLGALAERKSGDCLLDGIIELTLGIGDSMGVESGVFCSCPVETGTRARRVAETMEAVAANLELARPRDSVEDAVHDITRRFAAAQHLYFGSVASAAHAVEGLIDPDPRAPVDVGATITAMKDAEQSDLLAGDVYATELRAHRATLDALHRAQAQKSLHIDRSVLVYVYPFALDRFEASRVDDLVNKRITMNVAGAEPVDVEAHALQLTDLWTNPDREASDLGYGGVSIELPSLELTTTAREQSNGARGRPRRVALRRTCSRSRSRFG